MEAISRSSSAQVEKLFSRSLVRVDHEYQGKGLGRGLLRDAIQRTLQAASIVGIRGVFVHALSAEAKHFYEGAGFHESPLHPMLLMISLKEEETAFTG